MNAKEQLDLAAEIIGAKAWGFDHLKPRLYVPSRRDTKAFFEFPDFVADDLGGARFCVFIDDCGQPPAWYAGQKRKVIEANWLRGLALGALLLNDDESLAREIMELDEVTAEQVDQAGLHLANGRIAEARAVLFAAADVD